MPWFASNTPTAALSVPYRLRFALMAPAPEAAGQVELDPLYYLHNFEQLCHSVRDQYADLLNGAEQALLDAFFACDSVSRGLYVRLVSRRGDWFRLEKLDYPELGDDLAIVLRPLVDAGLVRLQGCPPLEVIGQLCLKGELLQVFAAELPAGAARLRKPELLESLLALEMAPELVAQRWQQWYPQALLEVCGAEVVELLQLLFFGNRRQSLTDFVLSDLGVANYENYPLDRRYRLFQTREQVDEYLYIAALSERYYKAVEASRPDALLELVTQLPDAVSPVPVLCQRWDRLRNRLGRELERYQLHEAALQAYALSARHPARERSVRVLEASGKLAQAVQLCEAIASEPWCEAELDFQRRKSVQLARKSGVAVTALKDARPASETLVLAAATERVEALAAQHYRQQWQVVEHVENTLINALFGLAFWEQIFAAVEGAFVNPFQSAPLDMYSREFYQTRRRAVDARLQQLLEAPLEAELLASYDAHAGVSNTWVNWRWLPRDLVAMAARLLPAAHLEAMWRRILFDPQANRSGLPDLLALDERRGYCMIEVKGPGDQLQLNQKRWLRFFAEREIPVKVAWVSWADD